MRHVFRVGDEGEVAGLRLRDAGNADDLDVTVSLEPARKPLRDVSKFQSAYYDRL
jgi:hypothetical protein